MPIVEVVVTVVELGSFAVEERVLLAKAVVENVEVVAKGAVFGGPQDTSLRERSVNSGANSD